MQKNEGGGNGAPESIAQGFNGIAGVQHDKTLLGALIRDELEQDESKQAYTDFWDGILPRQRNRRNWTWKECL